MVHYLVRNEIPKEANMVSFCSLTVTEKWCDFFSIYLVLCREMIINFFLVLFIHYFLLPSFLDRRVLLILTHSYSLQTIINSILEEEGGKIMLIFFFYLYISYIESIFVWEVAFILYTIYIYLYISIQHTQRV